MDENSEKENVDIEDIKKEGFGFFNKAKETFGHIKTAIDKVNYATDGLKIAYKKTTKAMTKMFVAVAIVSSVAQIGNIASIAHSNDYSWQPIMTDVMITMLLYMKILIKTKIYTLFASKIKVYV